MHSASPSRTNPNGESKTESLPTPQANTEVKDARSLLGQETTVDGSIFGKEYAGRKYTGTIINVYNSTKYEGYMYFTVGFEDCTQYLCLHELFKYGLITLETFTTLLPHCNPATDRDLQGLISEKEEFLQEKSRT